MKILMLISSFHPLVGGAEVQAQRLGKKLVSKGNEVTVLTRWHSGFKLTEDIDGINVIRLKVTKNKKLAPIIYLIRTIYYVWKNKKDIDIIHAHSLSSAGFTASLISFLFNIPSISKIAGGGNRLGCEAKRMYYGSWIKKFKILFMNKYLTKYIAISNAIYNDLNDIGTPSSKVKFIPNGIEIRSSQSIIPMELGELKVDKKRIFLYAGRLEKIKGIDVLLKAWHQTSEEFRKHNHLVILGEGSYDLSNYKDEQSISILGKVKNVNEFMRYSDFFILPSRYEGISNALLEAISLKLFSIVTNVGGNKDIVKNEETGMMFDNENCDQLREILERTSCLEESVKNEIINNAFNLVNSKYNLDNITCEYEKMYRDLLAE